MADAHGSQAGSGTNGFVIPPRISAQFPELSALIRDSESMNDEERRYWVDMLPIMTPEQLKQLRGILQNEKDQLAAIDAKYGKKIREMTSPNRSAAEIGAERRDKDRERKQKEEEARKQEKLAAERILQELE